jgi:hypothetical protein
MSAAVNESMETPYGLGTVVSLAGDDDLCAVIEVTDGDPPVTRTIYMRNE